MCEDRLALTHGQMLIWVPLFLCSKAFLKQFFLFVLERPIIKLVDLNFLLKFSDLKSDFTLSHAFPQKTAATRSWEIVMTLKSWLL